MAKKTKYERVSAELINLVGRGEDSGIWGGWDANKDFYLNELTPQRMDEVTSNQFNYDDLPRGNMYIPAEIKEQKIIYKLRNILDDAEWDNLSEIILEYKEQG